MPKRDSYAYAGTFLREAEDVVDSLLGLLQDRDSEEAQEALVRSIEAALRAASRGDRDREID